MVAYDVSYLFSQLSIGFVNTGIILWSLRLLTKFIRRLLPDNWVNNLVNNKFKKPNENSLLRLKLNWRLVAPETNVNKLIFIGFTFTRNRRTQKLY